MASVGYRSGRYTVTGTQVLSWRIQLPQELTGKKMEAFYREIETRVVRFCEKELCPWAERRFEACEDPKKRFHFSPFLYRVSSELWEEETRLTVFLDVTLERKGEREPLARWQMEQIWSPEEDSLLPPPKKKKEPKSAPKGNG